MHTHALGPGEQDCQYPCYHGVYNQTESHKTKQQYDIKRYKRDWSRIRKHGGVGGAGLQMMCGQGRLAGGGIRV